ncbi:MAG: hypothetical protein P8I13_07120 [Porticoccaceae bacterium]|nr:hypothetical protein [Porticoccaceae bacterium]
MKIINHVMQLIICIIFFGVAPISAEIPKNLRLSFIGGITLGGDEIAFLSYIDGSTDYVYAGRFAYIGGGLEYDINEDYILQLNAHYHWDSATAVNGDLTFSRYAFEVIPYYRLNDKYRIGLGLGIHTNVKLSSDFNLNEDFDNANAAIVSVGRKMKSSDSWLEFRLVSVEYSISNYDNNYRSFTVLKPFNGNHIGLSYHWLF